MHLLKERPNRFHAYVGVGQVVNMQDNERVSYEYTLSQARASGNEDAIKDLESIGRPPYTGSPEEIFEKLGIQRSWLLYFGGSIYGRTSMRELLKPIIFAPNFSLLDVYYWIDGNMFSVQNMDHFFELDLRPLGTEFEVPIFFFIGRHDYQTPFELSKPYFESLSAPHKEWLWFDKAVHAPPLSMPEEFARALIECVRPYTNPDQPAIQGILRSLATASFTYALPSGLSRSESSGASITACFSNGYAYSKISFSAALPPALEFGAFTSDQEVIRERRLLASVDQLHVCPDG